MAQSSGCPALAAVLALAANLFMLAVGMAVDRRGNEAHSLIPDASEPRGAASLHDELLEIGSADHLRRAMGNMTLPRALEVAPLDRHLGLRDFVHSALGAAGTSPASSGLAFLQTRSMAASAATAKAKAMDADGARALLNKMVEEAQGKLDLESVKCADASEKQRAMTEGARQDIGDYNAQAASARARILGTQTGISGLQDKLPRLDEALKLHDAKCSDDIAALKAQIDLITTDVGTLDQVAKLTSCDIKLTTELLECDNHTGGEDHHEDRPLSFLTFSHKVLRHHASKLRSHAAKAGLQRTLSETAMETEQRSGAEVHVRRRHHTALVGRHRRMRRQHHSASSIAGAKQAPTGGCQVRTAPTCDTLTDKFLVMQANIADKADLLRENLGAAEASCQETRGNYRAQIEELETRQQDQQAALAEATKVVIEAEEQSRLTGRSLQRLQQEAQRTADQCKSDLEAIATEICSVKQVRGELYKMEAKRPFIQDCEVSPWMPEECSAQCGGGTQKMVRSVVVPASMGATCPPLTMQRKCNEQACPVDCVLEEWGGWSACSAECGGGIMERVRSVRQQPSEGGRPCESTSESSSCNSAACDSDCALSEWTRFSPCSKACDGGFEVRKRHIALLAKGQGTCASADNPSRLQYRRCNEAKCEPKLGDTLKCTSKVDVVLILDGSGSLGEAGWAKVKSLGEKLVDSFQVGVEAAQVAVLLYSGPANWAAYQKCTAGTGTVDIAVDCKIMWVSHFTTDTAVLKSSVGALAWPKASTLTSAALATVESELRSGRAEAQSLVIAVTDGKAMNPHKTLQAARSLRNKARLMWVPVTSQANVNDIKSWASHPVADNVVLVSDFASLDSAENVNRIIADACPKVE